MSSAYVRTWSWNLARDSAGRVTARTEKLGAAAETQYVYGYDGLGRLVSVTKGGAVAEQYSYGANGERLSDRSGRRYTYDAEDRLVMAGDTAYEYDVDGF